MEKENTSNYSDSLVYHELEHTVLWFAMGCTAKSCTFVLFRYSVDKRHSQGLSNVFTTLNRFSRCWRSSSRNRKGLAEAGWCWGSLQAPLACCDKGEEVSKIPHLLSVYWKVPCPPASWLLLSISIWYSSAKQHTSAEFSILCCLWGSTQLPLWDTFAFLPTTHLSQESCPWPGFMLSRSVSIEASSCLEIQNLWR